jgi:hypothetical protein
MSGCLHIECCTGGWLHCLCMPAAASDAVLTACLTQQALWRWTRQARGNNTAGAPMFWGVGGRSVHGYETVVCPAAGARLNLVTCMHTEGAALVAGFTVCVAGSGLCMPAAGKQRCSTACRTQQALWKGLCELQHVRCNTRSYKHSSCGVGFALVVCGCFRRTASSWAPYHGRVVTASLEVGSGGESTLATTQQLG